MELRSTLTTGALALLLAACQSSMKVGSDFSPSTDFGGLETWDWMPPSEDPDAKLADDPRIDNELLEQRIRTALSAELLAHGFARSPEHPDFYVGYHAAVRSQESVETMNEYYGYGGGGAWDYGGGHGAGQVGRTETYVRTYDRGSLVIDIVRPGTKELIWRGYAEDEVDLFASPQDKQRTINKAVQKILSRFPPDGS